MKIKTFILASAAIVSYAACSNDLDETSNDILSEEITSEQMLSFQSEEEFENTIILLRNMNKQQQKEWIKKQKDNFTSLSDIYDNAMNDAADLDESQSSYEIFRKKYGSYLFFAEYKEDYGVYLTVPNPIVGILINKNGNVIIAGKICNKKDINSYVQLQRRGGTMYDDEVAHSNGALTRSYSYGDAFGAEYDSGWFHNNGKKIRLKVGRQYTDCQHPLIGNHLGYRLHFEISFRKKTWLGWTNYSSRINYEGSYQIGVAPECSVSEYKEADSSHDYYYGPFYLPFIVLPNNTIGVGAPDVHVKLNIHYRGISDDVMPKYDFTLSNFTTSSF